MPTLTQTNPVSPPSPSMPLSARSLALLLHARIQQLESVNSYVTCAGYLFLCIGCILIGIFIDNVINYYYPPPVLLQYPVLDPDVFQNNLPDFYPHDPSQIESSLDSYINPDLNNPNNPNTIDDSVLSFLFIRDKGYYSITTSLVEHFLDVDKTDSTHYRLDTNDCDDYSLMLMNHFHYSFQQAYQSDPQNNIRYGKMVPLFGMVYGSPYKNTTQNHAFNAFYATLPNSNSHSNSQAKNFAWYCIEPQNDTLHRCSSYSHHMYQFRLFLV